MKSLSDQTPFYFHTQQAEQQKMISEVRKDDQDSSKTVLQKTKKVQTHYKKRSVNKPFIEYEIFQILNC